MPKSLAETIEQHAGRWSYIARAGLYAKSVQTSTTYSSSVHALSIGCKYKIVHKLNKKSNAATAGMVAAAELSGNKRQSLPCLGQASALPSRPIAHCRLIAKLGKLHGQADIRCRRERLQLGAHRIADRQTGDEAG